MTEKSEESLVATLLQDHGLQPLRFSKREMRAGKTPDFRILRGSDLFAYCEVKSPRDEWLDEQLHEAEPGTIVGSVRNDPIFNRLSKMIKNAAKQFDAVNSDRTVPNILAIVNHDDSSYPGDLIETLTGMFHAEDGSRHPTLQRVSEGRIGEAKYRIDLYVWIDGTTGRVQAHLFSESVPTHVDALCAELGLDKTEIKR